MGNALIEGYSFGQIEDGAIAVGSSDNENPLMFKDTENDRFVFDLTIVDGNNIVAVPRNAQAHQDSFYIGAIVSPDRSIVYWVNDMKPLP